MRNVLLGLCAAGGVSIAFAADRTTDILSVSNEHIRVCLTPYDLQRGDTYLCELDQPPILVRADCQTAPHHGSRAPCWSMSSTFASRRSLNQTEFEHHLINLVDQQRKTMVSFMVEAGQAAGLTDTQIQRELHMFFAHAYKPVLSASFNPKHVAVNGVYQLAAFTARRHHTELHHATDLSSYHAFTLRTRYAGEYRFSSRLEAGNGERNGIYHAETFAQGTYVRRYQSIGLRTEYHRVGLWRTVASSRLSGLARDRVENAGQVEVTSPATNGPDQDYAFTSPYNGATISLGASCPLVY